MLHPWQIEELRERFLGLPFDDQLGLLRRIEEAEASSNPGSLALPELNAEELEVSGLHQNLMRGLVLVWQPRSEHFSTGNFLVENPSGKTTMSRGEFQNRLYDRLEVLVEADPKDAKRQLTDCPELNPDLYSKGMGSNPEHYAAMILSCDQMQMLLNRIDWDAPGENLFIQEEDLPSFAAIVESMPS